MSHVSAIPEVCRSVCARIHSFAYFRWICQIETHTHTHLHTDREKVWEGEGVVWVCSLVIALFLCLIDHIANHPRAPYTQHIFDWQTLILSLPLDSSVRSVVTSGRTSHICYIDIFVLICLFSFHILFLLLTRLVFSFYLSACVRVSMCVCIHVCRCVLVCVCFHAGHLVSVLFTHRTVFVCLFRSGSSFFSFRFVSYRFVSLIVCLFACLFCRREDSFTFHR